MARMQRQVTDNWKSLAGPHEAERRSGKDRRKRERRKQDVPVKVDRRSGGDRRSSIDRRQCPLA